MGCLGGLPKTFAQYCIPSKLYYRTGTRVASATTVGTGHLPARDIWQDGSFVGTGYLPGRDICRDGTFASTGRYSGIPACICLYNIHRIPFILSRGQ